MENLAEMDPYKTKLTVSANDAIIKFEYSHQQTQNVAYLDKSTGKIVESAVQTGQFNNQYQVHHIIGILNILKGGLLMQFLCYYFVMIYVYLVL
jgi:hypothetical protein